MYGFGQLLQIYRALEEEALLAENFPEYKKDLASPAFFHELRYDLGQSDITVFPQYRIRVKEVSNEYVRFMVIADK